MCTCRGDFEAVDEWLGQEVSVRGLKAFLNNPELVHRAKLIASMIQQYGMRSEA